MASHKMQRCTEDIHRELTDIFRSLKDPRVQGTMLSIVRVDVTNDLAYCRVYVSAMEGRERAETAVQGLTRAAGHIRSELGRRLTLRHTPQMIFHATDSIEYSATISRTLRELNNSEETDAENNEEE